MNETKRAEIETNYSVFRDELNKYIYIYTNKYALMRKGEVIEFYNSWQDAWKTGNKFFEDGLFSIQKVTKKPADLGYFSHAVFRR